MAAKKVDCGSSSFLSLNTTDKEPSNIASIPVNSFANDGSFFEQYKKRMEEIEKAKILAQTSSKKEEGGDERTSADINKLENKKSEDKPKTPVLKGNLLNQGKRQLLTGRMGGASKQFQAKKKKLEKQAAEEKNNVKSKDDGKNTAWKAYMEEVKKYREGSCTEEVDRVRPLVK